MRATFLTLLVEDNPADVRLTQAALKNGKVVHELRTVGDGVETMALLRRGGDYCDIPRPDIIRLDLNLPEKGAGGRPWPDRAAP